MCGSASCLPSLLFLRITWTQWCKTRRYIHGLVQWREASPTPRGSSSSVARSYIRRWCTLCFHQNNFHLITGTNSAASCQADNLAVQVMYRFLIAVEVDGNGAAVERI